MFAFIGLGTQEILLLLILGLGVAGAIFAVLLITSRQSGGRSQRVAELEDENRRLRAELDRDKPATGP